VPQRDDRLAKYNGEIRQHNHAAVRPGQRSTAFRGDLARVIAHNGRIPNDAASRPLSALAGLSVENDCDLVTLGQPEHLQPFPSNAQLGY
jgi:hypothetical protein